MRPVPSRASDVAVTQLLAERTRVGLWIMLTALAVLWATDVALDATLVLPLSLITLFQAACVGLGFVGLRFARGRRAVASTPIAVIFGIFVSGVVSDVISSNAATTMMIRLPGGISSRLRPRGYPLPSGCS